MVKLEHAQKKDFREAAQGFGVCTVAIVVLYLFSGMDVINMREMQLSLLMAILTACCAFYVTAAFISSKKRFLSLISALPAFGIYFLIFRLSFNACGRKTLPCISIMESVLCWAGLGSVIVSVVVLAVGKKLKVTDLVTAVLTAGFIMRSVMVLFTPLNFYQHDVANFSINHAGFHDTYIMYIYDNLALPDGDVRDYGQFYHPPLHHFMSAMFLKMQNASPLKFADDFDGLKILPMLWSSYLVLFAKKILERLKIDGKALLFSVLFITFSPHMIYLAIQVNNDPLALMLLVGAVYFALEWYKDPDSKKIVYTALCIGCAMMTKLSMGLVAFPIGWLFLVKLIKTVKANKEAKDRKPALKTKDLIKQFVFFAVVVFPLGLWFPLRNLIGYGVPMTYVYAIDSSAKMDVWMYSPLQRLLLPSQEILKTPFILEGGDVPENDFNILLALVKTGLFDERQYDNVYMVTIARIMVVLAFILIPIVLFAAVKGTLRRFKDSGKKLFECTEGTALWILAVVFVVSEIIFCFKYPVTCTASFRYISPSLIPAAFWCGSIMKMSEEKEAGKGLKIFSYCLKVLFVIFVLLVILFYGPFAQYTFAWQTLIKG